jgi:hypothetical protein
MTNAEIDALWFQAQRDAIKAGEDYARYRFAALVAATEREACTKILDSVDNYANPMTAADCAAAIQARSKT